MIETVLERLSEEECLQLLKSAEYGRVAVVADHERPEIFPVNFVLHEKTVAFVTGSPLLQAWAPLGKVAFEADWIDPNSHEGWDVVVTGVGADITDAVDELSRSTRADHIETWAPGARTAGSPSSARTSRAAGSTGRRRRPSSASYPVVFAGAAF